MSESTQGTSRDGVVISAADLAKTYRRGPLDVPVLRGLDLEVRRGEMAAVVGPSGSGKSTLLYVLGAMARPSAGRVVVAGSELSGMRPRQLARFRRREVGFVFQRFNLVASLSASDNIRLAARIKGAPLAAGEADRMLASVGLYDRSGFRPRELSMGQRQRVAIVRALVGEPSVVFADEPTGNLDSRTSDDIMDLFEGLNRERGQTILIVTHNAEVARRADRVYELHDGLITREFSPADERDGAS
jgi:ABC-type lipoprotein export system ATPase subunit